MVFKERPPRDKGVIEAVYSEGGTVSLRLLELHLYPGNQCNRDCDFCTVFGTPKGWYQDYTVDHLDAALRSILLTPEGTLKFFGGEPTLHPQNVIWAIDYLRQQGFTGSIVIYSNGIQAERLLQILQSDPLNRTTASLNYSIATGDGAPQMPQKSLELLEAYEQQNRGTIAIGHPDIVDSGRGVDPFTGEASRPKVNSRCPHCYPVLTSAGKFHACPFAVENQSEHFQLGDIHTDRAIVMQNFRAFFDWLDQVHEPFAVQQELPACTVCWKYLEQLPVPQFRTTDA